MHSKTQQSCHTHQTHTLPCPRPHQPRPFSAIHCTCSSFGIDVFTSVCNFLRAPEYILTKFANTHRHALYSHTHTQTHTLSWHTEAFTFAPMRHPLYRYITETYIVYMYMHPSICIYGYIIYDCTLYCFNFVIILPVAAQLHANALHLSSLSLLLSLFLSLSPSLSSCLPAAAAASKPILLIRRQILAVPLAV